MIGIIVVATIGLLAVLVWIQLRRGRIGRGSTGDADTVVDERGRSADQR